ncbi:MAG: lecithin retinol acyltransferase family protein [Algicola sp.]|nr:lecithin retinol acyltransferase family protein [Algicola sp.]
MNTTILDTTVDYITQQYIEQVFSGMQLEDHAITDEMIRTVEQPPIGAHLSTPRAMYTHHGLYIGNKEVIHYSGLAKGLSAGPVEKVSLNDFQHSNGEQKGYRIIAHPNASFNSEQIIENAYSRLNEKAYNLIWNNCEHFVHDCVYNQSKSHQVNSAIKLGTKNIAKGMGRSNIATSMAVTAVELTGSFKKYLEGGITGKRLIEDASNAALTTASVSYYGVLGQAAIPIPVVGFLIGSSIGLLIGNLLLSSGHLSLGESTAVKIARIRRQQIEALSKVLKQQIRESRYQLEQYLETYFSDRRHVIGNSLLQLENAVITNDVNTLTSALTELNTQFGCTLRIKSFEEFDQLMLSQQRLSF